eukprot:1159778-Pelagomonas_calceolata.AAC.17
MAAQPGHCGMQQLGKETVTFRRMQAHLHPPSQRYIIARFKNFDTTVLLQMSAMKTAERVNRVLPVHRHSCFESESEQIACRPSMTHECQMPGSHGHASQTCPLICRIPWACIHLILSTAIHGHAST